MSENENFDYESVTLTDEDGVERDFQVIGNLEMDGFTYLALVPDNSDDDEYIILKLVDENGEEVLVTIDDDDEFDKVADAFENEVLAEYDYDEGDEEEYQEASEEEDNN
ncbi:hypothetical protein SDC9_176815 [bioreactor metagenome]|uniref:Uncharacterized protein n=1 Tax=bioreactor metagenome TaxID=1076179 RepID=A0A645GTS4_9ZZZZ|nr:DUF1292 domain-containing protein [Oscillospiraceae bacterium]